MKIIELNTENVKRLKAISIVPNSNAVIIGGNNAQGKSSVLDAIFMGLSGKKAQGIKPVRAGEEKASIVVDLGEYKVTRTITASGGGTVKVENKEGAVFSSPQKILDGLCSTLSFDPLAFMREKPNDQRDTLQEMVGVDFSGLDSERSQIFNERTSINRQGKEEKARLDGLTVHDGAPAKEVSVAALVEEMSAAEKKNRQVDAVFLKVDKLEMATSGLLDDIAELELELKAARASLSCRKKELEESSKVASRLKRIDTKPIIEKIESAEVDNRKCRENKELLDLEKKVGSLRVDSQSMTDRIIGIDAKKASLMSDAKFPIKGLSFSEDGIVYHGIPFSQCSSAEQLRVSVGMGIAMNPELKILLIRDGSLLDADNLAIVVQMAEESDAQVWIERVGKGDECSVIISDGMVEVE